MTTIDKARLSELAARLRAYETLRGYHETGKMVVYTGKRGPAFGDQWEVTRAA